MIENEYLSEVSEIMTPSKYKNLYVSIINNALIRQNGICSKKLRKKLKEQLNYVESHHILPKCMCTTTFQKNDKLNLVFLTAREHFICHWLLIKMTPG